MVLNLFNDRRDQFERLTEGGNPACHASINSFPAPEFFIIPSANNLGLHLAHGGYVLFANSDVIYPRHYLRTVVGESSRRGADCALGTRVSAPRTKQTLASSPAHGTWRAKETHMVRKDGRLRFCQATMGGNHDPFR